MSDFDNYISKLECAKTLAYARDCLKDLTYRADDEYRFWLKQSGLPRWMLGMESDGICHLISGAKEKHEHRLAKKEAP